MEEKNFNFQVILLGIIYDTENKKILIGRREEDPIIPELTWCFPGGRLIPGEKIEKSIKKIIKNKTDLKIENLGNIFSKVYPEKKDLLAIYFLCEKIDGKEKCLKDFVELKWVKPEEIEEHFTTDFHPNLKEYILNLK